MWGNQQGWLISLVLVGLAGVLLYFAAVPPGISEPSNAADIQLAMQAAVLPTDPSVVMPAPEQDCNAGEAYLKAAQDWQAHEQDYAEFDKKLTEVLANEPEAVKQVLAGAHCARMNLFASHPDQVINYHSDRPMLDSLAKSAVLCQRIALLYTTDSHNDPAKAKEYATAAFNAGRHLYEERICFLEWEDGITLMEGAAEVLQRIEKDDTRSGALKEFVTGVNAFNREKVKRVWEIISGLGDDDKARYAGDLFKIAQSSPDRMWRVEAILKLGRFKFNAATRGDQYGAKRTLRMMSTAPSLSPDPLTQSTVKTAVNAANGLTIEDYRQI